MANLIKLKSGDTPTIRLKLVDGNGDAANVTGYTLKFKISTNLDDADASAVYMLTVAPASISDPTNGIHDEEVSEDTTKDWTPGLYKYQARWIDGGGAVTSTDIGKCAIEENLIDDET